MGAWQTCPFQQAQARSKHPGFSVHVAMADGTIRTVQRGVPQAIWWYMHGRDDAVTYDANAAN